MAVTPKPKPKPRPGEGRKKPGGGREIALTAAVFTAICDTLSRTGAKYKSCQAHGFSYAKVQEAINLMVNRGDDSWRFAWNTAFEHWKETLEVEAYRRGHDGVPVEWKTDPATGERVAVRWEFSDRMLELLMKGHFPERFRENIHHSGQLGLEPVDAFSNLTARAKREIRAIILRDLEEQREAADAVRLEAAGGLVIEGEAVELQLADLRAEKRGTAGA